MIQKATNYLNALQRLREALQDPIEKPRDLAGIIQSFEFVYELSWKFLKAYLADQGQETGPPRNVFEKAYQHRIINNELVWLDILKSRNVSTHTYNQSLAKGMIEDINKNFLIAFEEVELIAKSIIT